MSWIFIFFWSWKSLGKSTLEKRGTLLLYQSICGLFVFCKQLEKFGVSVDDVTWSRVTMMCDSFVCIRQRKIPQSHKQQVSFYFCLTCPQSVLCVCFLSSCLLQMLIDWKFVAVAVFASAICSQEVTGSPTC